MELALPDLPLRLNEASGVPFYRQLVDQIAAAIRSGRLAPGTRLPSVRELAAQVLVSLITVRRAYAELEQAGLIQRRQGQGTFVAPDVGKAARQQALSQARVVLRDAVARARQLGLDDRAQRACLERIWSEGGSDGAGAGADRGTGGQTGGLHPPPSELAGPGG